MKNDSVFVIFGASGDLAKRMIYPALHGLFKTGVKCQYIGYGRTDYSDEAFRKLVKAAVPEAEDSFINEFSYVAGEYNSSGMEKLKGLLAGKSVTYYLSIPTKYSLISEILDGFVKNDLIVENARIVLEKPFGSDYLSAQKLSKLVENKIGLDKIHLVDHYLAKDLVRDLITLRFANPVFENLWNNKFIESIEIDAIESVGVNNRGEFYDKTGAIRDMIQNHGLQLLALTTMNQPASFSFSEFVKEKVSVLNNLKVFGERSSENIMIGQYKGYLEETHVDPNSLTETFASIVFGVDNDRWHGVPIKITTGKKLSEKRTSITVTFRPELKCIWGEKCSELERNKLVINIYPDNEIRFGVNSEFNPGKNFPTPLDLVFSFSDNVEIMKSPYENALLDIHNQEKMYTPSFEEILSSWKIIDRLIDEIGDNREKMLSKYSPDFV